MWKTPTLSGLIKTYKKKKARQRRTERNVQGVMNKIKEREAVRQGQRKNKCGVIRRDSTSRNERECAIVMPVCRPVSKRAGRRNHEWKERESWHSLETDSDEPDKTSSFHPLKQSRL